MRYLDLDDYLLIAERVLGIDAAVLGKTVRIDLADSALHAPQAAFGGQEFYPDPVDKAAVLVCHLTWNHPLPDGNKRSAWLALRMFVLLNGIWLGDPTIEAEDIMVSVAQRGMEIDDVTDWLSRYVEFSH